MRSLARPDEIFFASVHLYDRTSGFYPCSGGSDSLADNVMNLPVAPLWKTGSAPARKRRKYADLARARRGPLKPILGVVAVGAGGAVPAESRAAIQAIAGDGGDANDRRQDRRQDDQVEERRPEQVQEGERHLESVAVDGGRWQ